MSTSITANGINFPNGSAGTPSVAGSDTDTGLFYGTDIVGFATGGSERLRIDASGNVNIANDSGKLQLGASNDLQIYHDGSNSILKDSGTGSIITQSDSWIYWKNAAGTETIIKGGASAQVELYYANNKRLETTSAGVTVSGSIDVNDNCKLLLGDGDDLQIDHSGTNSQIYHNGTGHLYIATLGSGEDIIFQAKNELKINTADSERMRIDSSGSVKIATTDGSPHANADELVIGDPSGTVRSGMTFNAGANKDSSIHFGDPDSNLSGQITYDHNGDILRFYTANDKRVRIDSDGLKFGNDTAAANALDDYEQGTYTPTLIYQNTSGLTLAVNSASGKYTKIGNVCYVLGYINWDVSGSPINDNVGFGGLPFSTATGQISAGTTRLVWNVTLYNTNAQSVTHQLLPYGTNAVSLSLESEQGNRSNELGSGSGFQARWQGWYYTE